VAALTGQGATGAEGVARGATEVGRTAGRFEASSRGNEHGGEWRAAHADPMRLCDPKLLVAGSVRAVTLAIELAALPTGSGAMSLRGGDSQLEELQHSEN
jgi:hypothetical protein